eukprot:1160369-Pelagomonas_calceolata.AAC.1
MHERTRVYLLLWRWMGRVGGHQSLGRRARGLVIGTIPRRPAGLCGTRMRVCMERERLSPPLAVEDQKNNTTHHTTPQDGHAINKWHASAADGSQAGTSLQLKSFLILPTTPFLPHTCQPQQMCQAASCSPCNLCQPPVFFLSFPTHTHTRTHTHTHREAATAASPVAAITSVSKSWLAPDALGCGLLACWLIAGGEGGRFCSARCMGERRLCVVAATAAATSATLPGDGGGTWPPKMPPCATSGLKAFMPPPAPGDSMGWLPVEPAPPRPAVPFGKLAPMRLGWAGGIKPPGCRWGLMVRPRVCSGRPCCVGWSGFWVVVAAVAAVAFRLKGGKVPLVWGGREREGREGREADALRLL